MFRPFRSLIALVLVVSLFFPSQSRAFDPLSITAFVGYSLFAHGSVAGLYYYFKTRSSSVDSVGTISKDTKVQWIDAKDIQVQSKDLKASQSISKIKSAATSKPTKYPNLKSALTQNTSSIPTLDSSVGEVVAIVGYGDRKITSVEFFTNASQNAAFAGTRQYTETWTTINGPIKSNGYYDAKTIYYSKTAATFVPVERTPSSFAATISSNGVSGDVVDLYQDEIDKMMADPDYVPVFSDATTGLPYAPPAQSEVMTPGQVDTYNKVGAAKEAAQAAAGSAGQAASNAGKAYTDSGGDLSTGTGGDASLYQKYLDAKAAADKAAADAAETESDKTDNSAYEGSFDNSAAYGDQSKDFEFGTRFQAFFNEMKNTSLFSLPNQFLGDIPSSSTSSMTIQGGRFGSFTYDFAQFNGLFIVIKSILLVLFSWVSARIVMLKGGGG